MRVRHSVLLWLILIFASTSLLRAQDDYQKWLQKDRQQFKNYLDKEDKAFSDFLKKDWEAFRAFQGLKADVKPKPVKMPVAETKDKPKIPPKTPLKKIVKAPPPKPLPAPKPKPLPAVHPGKPVIRFQYMGLELPVEYKKDFDLSLQPPFTNKKISAAWETIAKSSFKNVVKQVQAYRKKMALNDWGYAVLLHAFATKVAGSDVNQAKLLTWFLMVKNGYDVKIAYKTDTLFLLAPASQTIYGTPFITMADKRYYFINFSGNSIKTSGKIYTYQGNYQNAEARLALSIRHIPILKDKTGQKILKFNFHGKPYRIAVKFDTDVITFFKNYPQTDLSVYFGAPISPQAYNSLLNSLKPYVEGKNEVEAVNFLLRLVQKSFNYKTDDQQFGKEKYLMPEETMYYPASDCEDRSILFSYLVKNLLGLEVVALDYPGHISTAVRFHEDLPGAAVTFKGKKYLICDPTYINADAGMVMPNYKDVAPKVLAL